MRVELTPGARKDLSKLDKPIQKRIQEDIDKFREDPSKVHLCKVVSKKDTLRMSVGHWRVFLKLDRKNRMYFVTEIIRRRENTYD